MFSVAIGYVTTLAIKEACFKSIKGCINQLVVYLHMKYSVIPLNHKVTTLAYVVNVCPDMLKSV